MNKNMKLSMGLLLTSSVIALPIVTAVSCGDNKENTKLKNDNDLLNDQINDFNDKVKDLNSKITKLNKIILDKTANIKTSQDEKAKLESIKVELEAKLKATQSEKVKLEADLKASQSEKAKLDAIKVKLEANLKTSQSEKANLEAVKVKLESIKVKLEADLKASQIEKDKLDDTLKTLQSEMQNYDGISKTVLTKVINTFLDEQLKSLNKSRSETPAKFAAYFIQNMIIDEVTVDGKKWKFNYFRDKDINGQPLSEILIITPMDRYKSGFHKGVMFTIEFNDSMGELALFNPTIKDTIVIDGWKK